MEVFTKCCNKVNLTQEQPKSWGNSCIQSPNWWEADGQISNSGEERDSNYTQHKGMSIWWFSQQVKPDSSMKAKWCYASWSLPTQQEPVIRSHCLSKANHCWGFQCFNNVPLKQATAPAWWTPHPREYRLNILAQVATTQKQAGALGLCGISAHKHLRQKQQADAESVAVWHLHSKHCFFQQGTTFRREGHHKLYLGVEQYQNQYSSISLYSADVNTKTKGRY